MHHASARPQKYPPGQACHVGQIRLSDWLKFEMLASDWSVPKPTPCTTKRYGMKRSTSCKFVVLLHPTTAHLASIFFEILFQPFPQKQVNM